MQEMETVKRSVFPPKSYRIELPYFLAFEACASVNGPNKRELLFAMLDANKEIDAEKLKKLPEVTQNILAEKMLESVKELGKPLKEAKSLLNWPKIKNLITFAHEKLGMVNEMPLKHLRILPEYQEFVNIYSGSSRAGETLELAIALFVNESSEFEYSLIETVFRTLVKKYSSKEGNQEKEQAKYKTYRFKTSFYLAFEILTGMYGVPKKRQELIDRLPVNLKNYVEKHPEYTQNEMAEVIVSALVKEKKTKDELSYLFEDLRIKTLLDIMKNKKVKNKKERKSLKLAPEYDDFMKEFSSNVGDALEYALALFIVNQDRNDYEVLESAFNRYVEEKKK